MVESYLQDEIVNQMRSILLYPTPFQYSLGFMVLEQKSLRLQMATPSMCRSALKQHSFPSLSLKANVVPKWKQISALKRLYLATTLTRLARTGSMPLPIRQASTFAKLAQCRCVQPTSSIT